MKLIFFLIAFSIIAVRYYFSWTGLDRQRKGYSDSNIVIKSDDFYESTNYFGKIQLTDDESGVRSISPGGYIRYQQNDLKINAESNLRGEIEYKITHGKNKIANAEESRQLVAGMIREMIYWGYDAGNRMNRVFLKGGNAALLNEIDSMRTDELKQLYLNRLFSVNSLYGDTLALAIKKSKTLGSDMNKLHFLNGITGDQLKNPVIVAAYFDLAREINSDMDKSNALMQMIDSDTPDQENVRTLAIIANSLGSDMEKVKIFDKLIERGLITGPLIDSLSLYIAEMNSDMDKSHLFTKMLVIKPMENIQWINLIGHTASMESDGDKTNTLIEIAHVMPRTDSVKAAFLLTAKTVQDNNNYGRLVRELN